MLGFHTVSQQLGPLFTHPHTQGADGNPPQPTYFPLLSSAGPQYIQFPNLAMPSLPTGDAALPELFKIPPEATNCLYIEGIPIDAKEREVARTFVLTQTSSALTQASSRPG